MPDGDGLPPVLAHSAAPPSNSSYDSSTSTSTSTSTSSATTTVISTTPSSSTSTTAPRHSSPPPHPPPPASPRHYQALSSPKPLRLHLPSPSSPPPLPHHPSGSSSAYYPPLQSPPPLHSAQHTGGTGGYSSPHTAGTVRTGGTGGYSSQPASPRATSLSNPVLRRLFLDEPPQEPVPTLPLKPAHGRVKSVGGLGSSSLTQGSSSLTQGSSASVGEGRRERGVGEERVEGAGQRREGEGDMERPVVTRRPLPTVPTPPPPAASSSTATSKAPSTTSASSSSSTLPQPKSPPPQLSRPSHPPTGRRYTVTNPSLSADTGDSSAVSKHDNYSKDDRSSKGDSRNEDGDEDGDEDGEDDDEEGGEEDEEEEEEEEAPRYTSKDKGKGREVVPDGGGIGGGRPLPRIPPPIAGCVVSLLFHSSLILLYFSARLEFPFHTPYFFLFRRRRSNSFRRRPVFPVSLASFVQPPASIPLSRSALPASLPPRD